MNLVARDPFLKDFTALTNRFNRFFDLPRESNVDYLGAWNPAVDIFDKGAEVVIHAELPGIQERGHRRARREQCFDHPWQERAQGRSEGRGLLPNGAFLRFLQPVLHGWAASKIEKGHPLSRASPSGDDVRRL